MLLEKDKQALSGAFQNNIEERKVSRQQERQANIQKNIQERSFKRGNFKENIQGFY